jgi:hypothetical protein
MKARDVSGDLQFASSIGGFEGHLLAGFLEGEIHLGVCEQNGGQSYSCFARVTFRDDDAAVLEWALALTGVGTLRRKPARRTSKPQVGWHIDSRDDCLELCNLLECFPFRGRKRLELTVWREAVTTWYDDGPERRETLRGLKRRLEALRRFQPNRYDTAPPPSSQTALAGYISGFVMAEGHLRLAETDARLQVNLRADDLPLLRMLAAESGLGTVNRYEPPGVNPTACWIVTARGQLVRLASWLYAAGLPGHKGAMALIWAEGVGHRGIDDPAYRAAVDRLAELRPYRPPDRRPLIELPKPDVPAMCKAALLAWAQDFSGPLSCGDYATWRLAQPDRTVLPYRNTFARTFGSWHAALEAAGLADRAARAPWLAGGAERRQRRREEQRARVVDTVVRFKQEFGRLPRAVEFFRWRLRAAPNTPTQATIYKLFPNGWAEVLEACDGSASGRP